MKKSNRHQPKPYQKKYHSGLKRELPRKKKEKEGKDDNNNMKKRQIQQKQKANSTGRSYSAPKPV